MTRQALLAVAAIVLIGGCGKKETPAAPVPQAPAPAATESIAAPPAPAVPAAANAAGEDVYRKACRACHELGITGAPKLGDAADWGPRIAQGMDVLHDHSLKGYTGKKGVMPPKGGFTNLSDAEVTAAVDYMVSRAQ